MQADDHPHTLVHSFAITQNGGKRWNSCLAWQWGRLWAPVSACSSWRGFGRARTRAAGTTMRSPTDRRWVKAYRNGGDVGIASGQAKMSRSISGRMSRWRRVACQNISMAKAPARIYNSIAARRQRATCLPAATSAIQPWRFSEHSLYESMLYRFEARLAKYRG